MKSATLFFRRFFNRKRETPPMSEDASDIIEDEENLSKDGDGSGSGSIHQNEADSRSKFRIAPDPMMSDEVVTPDPTELKRDVPSGYSEKNTSATRAEETMAGGVSTLALAASKSDGTAFAKTEKRTSIPHKRRNAREISRVSILQLFSRSQVEEKELMQSRTIRPLEGKSLYYFSSDSEVRNYIADFVRQPAFDNSILVLIMISSVLLVLDNPLNDPNSDLAEALGIIEIIVTCIFATECLLKIISYGFLFNGKESYLQDGWNILDFFIVVVSIISLFMSGDGGDDLKTLKVLRILRVLRPLRVISRNEGLKLAVNSLIRAIPQIANVLIICLLFFLLFGIFGVNFFKGTFFHCDMTNVPHRFQKVIETSYDCMNYGGDWVNREENFDNSLSAMLTLFIMCTTEGWVDIMWSGVDSKGINYEPVKDHRRVWIIFFIVFIIVGSFFILNLFVGVVIDTFHSEKEKLGGYAFLTEDQMEWVQIKTKLLNAKPIYKIPTPEHPLRQRCKTVADNRKFEGFIMLCIILNTLALAMKWYRLDVGDELEIINFVFAGIFTLEAIIKIAAYGKYYFRDGWNLFDFSIVIGTLIGVVLTVSVGLDVGTTTSLIRAFRIGRILRLIRSAKSLRMIFNTFILTLPALANIGGLLILLLYIYAVLGINLFAKVKLQDNLNSQANFQSFGSAFMILVRASTGEGWNLLMWDCGRPNEVNFSCKSSQTYDQIEANDGVPEECGNAAAAYLYFVSFTLIITFIFLNLFIAVILQGFGDASASENCKLTDEEYDHFREAWMHYDNKATCFIDKNDLPSLLDDLGPPLGWDRTVLVEKVKQEKFIASLDLPIHGTKLHFWEVASSIAKRLFLETSDEQLSKFAGQREFHDEFSRRIEDFSSPVMKKLERKKWKSYPSLRQSKPEFSSAQIYAVNMIQRRFRARKARRAARDDVNSTIGSKTIEVNGIYLDGNSLPSTARSKATIGSPSNFITTDDKNNQYDVSIERKISEYPEDENENMSEKTISVMGSRRQLRPIVSAKSTRRRDQLSNSILHSDVHSEGERTSRFENHDRSSHELNVHSREGTAQNSPLISPSASFLDRELFKSNYSTPKTVSANLTPRNAKAPNVNKGWSTKQWSSGDKTPKYQTSNMTHRVRNNIQSHINTLRLQDNNSNRRAERRKSTKLHLEAVEKMILGEEQDVKVVGGSDEKVGIDVPGKLVVNTQLYGLLGADASAGELKTRSASQDTLYSLHRAQDQDEKDELSSLNLTEEEDAEVEAYLNPNIRTGRLSPISTVRSDDAH